MASNVTDVSICSNALLRLGSDPINSFTEGDLTGSNIERARMCANLWPTVRRKVLRGGTWNCALKRVLLSPDQTAPAFEFAYRFQRPGDWLRTVRVGSEEFAGITYRTEGTFFLTDFNALPLLYVFDNTVTADYDAGLVEVLELGMMAVLAYPITKSTSLADGLQAQLKDMLTFARGVDGQDDPPEDFGDMPMTRSRFGGFGYPR